MDIVYDTLMALDDAGDFYEADVVEEMIAEGIVYEDYSTKVGGSVLDVHRSSSEVLSRMGNKSTRVQAAIYI